MLRICFLPITIGSDTQNPSRTVDPAQLALMFPVHTDSNGHLAPDSTMDGLLSKVDVFGIFAQFGQTSKHTTASDAMLARMLVYQAVYGFQIAISYSGLIGYGGTPNFISGLSTPTQQGTLAAANDLAATGVYGLLASLGVVPDWNIMDSPLDRVTNNNALNKSPHVSHHGFGSTTNNNSVVYTAGTTGSAGNNITVAHIASGNSTPLSVSATVVSVLSDTFTRTVSAGWSSPDVGPAYALTGTASDFNVGSGVGTISVPTSGTVRLVLNATTAPVADERQHLIFSLDAVPSGNFADVGVVLRAVDASNYYDFRARCTTTGTIQAGIFKTVAGTSTQLVQTGALSGLTLAGGTQFWVEGKASGSTLTCTIWAVGTNKPAASTSVTDTTFAAAGSAGVRVATGSASSSLPRVASIDSLRVDDTAQDGTAITVNLQTNSGGTAISTAADVIAAVNLSPDASSLVIASSSGGTGLGISGAFAVTNLAFGDDGVNLSNHDSAVALTQYIAAIHAALPNHQFMFTEDIRRPYAGVTGYSASAYPADQMPDFADFWPEFVTLAHGLGIQDVVKGVMWDTTPELNAGLLDTNASYASLDWWGRGIAEHSQVQADDVVFVANMGMSSNSFPSLDSHNSVGPASARTTHDHLVQQGYDWATERVSHPPESARFLYFLWMDFGYYPRVLLKDGSGLTAEDDYLDTYAAFLSTDTVGYGTGPAATALVAVPVARATAPVPVATATSPRPS